MSSLMLIMMLALGTGRESRRRLIRARRSSVAGRIKMGWEEEFQAPIEAFDIVSLSLPTTEVHAKVDRNVTEHEGQAQNRSSTISLPRPIWLG
jgi:hypothetical protein